MSREQMREHNKQLTVEKALALFLQQGVEQTSIRDVAAAAGLTERSVYRYFANKAELVLATAFAFWARVETRVERLVSEQSYQGMRGIEQIEIMLRFYSGFYLENPAYVRFILGAETALYQAGVTADIRARPPGAFESGETPLVRAIHTGLRDGSVSPDVDVKEIYYNAYDSILGTMQRQAIGSPDGGLDPAARMQSLCRLFVGAFQGHW